MKVINKYIQPMYEQILVYNYFFQEITGSGSICI